VRGREVSRDRRLRRFRTLDSLLGVGLLILLIALTATRAVTTWQAYALVTLLLAPLFAWMSWRQYVVLDEYGRTQLLAAYGVAGIVTLTALLLLGAWAAWTQAAPATPALLLILSGVFLVGWASSWVTWLWLRRERA